MTATDATLDGLLRDVIAYPDDDVVRLIYADRCEELGQDARAEFIRVQVELAVLLQHQDRFSQADISHLDPQRGPVDRKARRLHKRARELAGVVTPPHVVFTACEGWDWRRGFVEAFQLSANEWLAHADALAAATPLKEVRLTTWPRLTWRAVAGAWLASLSGPQKERWYGVEYENRDLYPAPHLLAAEWPNITFVLPESQRTTRSSTFINVTE